MDKRPGGTLPEDAAVTAAVVPAWLITDFDRLGHTMHGSRADADAAAEALADRFPGNVIHVLETVAAFHRPRGAGKVLCLPVATA